MKGFEQYYHYTFNNYYYIMNKTYTCIITTGLYYYYHYGNIHMYIHAFFFLFLYLIFILFLFAYVYRYYRYHTGRTSASTLSTAIKVVLGTVQ